MSDGVRTQIDWKDFNSNSVILPICMRSPNVQGRNFTAMLDAMAKRIDTVHVVLCDLLDRHNLDGGMDEALELSRQWQARNIGEVHKRFKSVSITD